ncbi:hypothetical protein Trydic_g10851 [Trypoxylus dichotomus]
MIRCLAFVAGRIHHTRKELSPNDAQLYQLRVHLGNKLNSTDWDLVDSITHGLMVSRTQMKTRRQIKNYDCCPSTHNLVPQLDASLDRERTTEEISVLSKGLTMDAAEEIRRETSRILQHAKPPKSNFSNKERSAIKSLNADKNIIVLSAEKRNATTVLNYGDYTQKIRILLDTENYRKLLRDPTGQILRKTNQLITISQIPAQEQIGLIISEAPPPRLYGLPGIHKPPTPNSERYRVRSLSDCQISDKPPSALHWNHDFTYERFCPLHREN